MITKSNAETRSELRADWRRVCAEFMDATSYAPGDLEPEWWKHVDQSKRPPQYLSYEDAVVRIPLGQPEFPPSPDLWQLIETRRSKRNFVETPMTLNELNALLWSTQAITGDRGAYQVRTVSSAGALYPIETYMLVNNVEGLEPGLYHLNVQDWCLEGLKLGDVREFSFEVTEGQEMARIAAVNFVWTALIERTRYKYQERAYRYVMWDVGHVAQNLHIAANALGLGVCTIGHWFDVTMHDYLGIDGQEHFSALMASVGKVEGQDWLKDRRPAKK